MLRIEFTSRTWQAGRRPSWVDAGGDLRTRRLVADGYLEDEAVVVSADVLAIDPTPFVAGGGLVQMMGPPVAYALAPIPVLVAHVVALSPIVMVDVVVVVVMVLVLMVLVIVMVLRNGGTAGEGEGKG